MLLDEPGLEKTSCACYRASLRAYEQMGVLPGKPRATRAAPIHLRR